MKTFNQTWNYNLNDMPSLGEKIMLDMGNGMGTDRRFPYIVESIQKNKRGNFSVYYVEGRQLKKDGTVSNGTFMIFFTDRPKDGDWDMEKQMKELDKKRCSKCKGLHYSDFIDVMDTNRYENVPDIYVGQNICERCWSYLEIELRVEGC